MSYGIVLPHPYLPWDQPLNCGAFAVHAEAEKVSLTLEGEMVGFLDASDAARMGFATPVTGILQMASALARGAEKQGEIMLSGERVLKVFSDPESASRWRAGGQAQSRSWDQGLRELLKEG